MYRTLFDMPRRLEYHSTIIERCSPPAGGGREQQMDWPVALVASVTIATVGAVVVVVMWKVMEIAKERSADDARQEHER
jgi:hypothetical protein